MAETTIAGALTILAERAPDRVAVRCGSRTLSRRGLVESAARLAGAWRAEGLREDDVVAVCLPNGVDFVLACAATWFAGATVLAVSVELPVAERRTVLAEARPARVVDGPPWESVTMAKPEPAPPDRAARSWKISTSSGTTGVPKLVVADHAAYVDPDRPVAPFLPVDMVQLVCGPLAHAAPFTYAMRGLMTGHELVVLPTFDPGEALAAIERHRVTWTMLVPTTMQQIIRHPGRSAVDVSSLRTVLHLGARCPAPLKREWIGWLGPERVVEVYTGTEAPGIAMIDGVEWLAHPGSVGRPMPGSRFRVVDDAGREVEASVLGTLQMQRDGGRPGWHSLGDLGWIDDDGYVHVADRAADVIRTAAGMVHPADVEAVLDSHPDVSSSVVVGRPGAGGAQQVHAVVQPAASWLDLRELRRWVADRLPEVERPVTYELVGTPLRASTGKSRRRDWR